MKKCNISTNHIRVIKHLYDKATSAVLFNGSEQQLESDRNVYSLHPLQRISGKDHGRRLEDHEGTVSIGGRTITNLRFADDTDGSAGEEKGLAKLVERLDKAFTAYGMEISAEKTCLTTNNNGAIYTEIKVNGQTI